MRMSDAIKASQILAARGFNNEGQCVVSVAEYGGKLMWLEGWGGNWKNEWVEIPSEKLPVLDDLDFKPTGPPPDGDTSAVKEVFSYIDEIEEDYNDGSEESDS